MYVYCKKCGYDSSDKQSNTELAEKVNNDGGDMEMHYDENGKPKGWDIVCPKCRSSKDCNID